MTSGHEKYGIYRFKADRDVGFLLLPTFPVLGFVSALEPLRVANRLSGRALYRWQVFSADAQPVEAVNGMVHAVDAGIDQIAEYPTIIVCGVYDPKSYWDPRVFAWLRKLAMQGTTLGAVETGSYVLAQARLLDGYRCTIHWENMPGFRDAFPHITVSGELIEFDRNRFTCAGGTAALDMMLQMIEQHHGHDLAVAVSENFIHSVIRNADDTQRMTIRTRTGVTNAKLLECLELMEANVEQPLTPAELSAAVGISKRQLERLFRRYLDTTPSRHYTEFRLRQGRRLLEQTSLPVTDIALACGFPSPGYFSHRYRSLFGVSPRQERGISRGNPSQTG